MKTETSQFSSDTVSLPKEGEPDFARIESELAEKNVELQKTRIAMINILDDIFQEKKISDNRAEDLQKFQMAAENVSQPTIITDADGVILYANPAVTRVTGYSHAEIVGNKPSLWGKQMPEEFYSVLWKTIKQDKKNFADKLKNKKKNGETYLAYVTISPILSRDGQVKFFVGLETDITEQEMLNQSRISFISIASHQLRTPLTSMRWFSEMLIDGDAGEITDEQKHFIERIYQGTNRMIDLVNLLLQIARVESGRVMVDPVPVDLGVIAREAISSVQIGFADKKLSVSVSVPKDSFPPIPLDKDIIWNVIQNLLTNAFRYSKKQDKIAVSFEIKDEEILCSVADNGIGIPTSAQGKIFEKFYRAENAIKHIPDGSGLGLNLVKSLVESWGGKIWFESKEGRGTTFFFTIPIRGMERKEGEVRLAV